MCIRDRLNIIGYFQDKGYEFGPSIMGSEANNVGGIMNVKDTDDNTDPEDWSL